MKKIYLTIFLLGLVIMTGCKKNGSTDDSSATTGDYYFKGTLNDQALSWQGTDDFSGYVTGLGSSFSLDSKGIRTGSLIALFSSTNNGTYQPQLGVEFRTYSYSYDLKDKPGYFAGFITTGSIPLLTTNTFTINTKTLVINYTDAQGKTYNSIGAQSVATANIISISNVPAQYGRNESLKIKLTFSCKLYPSNGSGSVLNLTNAEATIRLEDGLI